MIDQETSITMPGPRLTEDHTSALAPESFEMRDVPPGNPGAPPQGLEPGAMRNISQKLEPGADRQCSAMTGTGRCGQRMTLLTASGYRCRFHRGGGPREQRRPRLPVRALRTLADAATLASWAALQAANGRMAASEAGSIAALIREWRQSFGDAHTLGRFNELEKQIAELTRRA